MSDFKSRMSDVRFNPGLMQNVMLDELERQVTGRGDYDVPDAGHPFVFLMEASVLNAAMNHEEGEALLRRLYPSMAINQEELYLHMADHDYLNRFSIPAWTTFDVYLSLEEVKAKAVSTGEGGVKKLVIPRLTRFRVADTSFTMQYPIELRIMSHGGLQVVFDGSDPSPVYSLESNMVDWDIVRLNREELLVIHAPAGQFNITTFSEAVNTAAAFNSDFGFNDQFYYARVYLSQSNGQWREIKTTHTDQVFDPTELTAVLRVDTQSLNVSIPMVYASQGMLDGEIRIDIYTTKGAIDMDLGGYQPDQFTMDLIDTDDDKRYVAPLTTFTKIHALSPYRVTGGAPGVDFETLRRQVINNTLGASQLPITHAQIGNALETRGYQVVTNIDNITNRQFLASRRFPTPTDQSISGSVGVLMGTLQARLEDIVLSEHVHDNGERVTLKPSLLYQYQEGRVEIVHDGIIRELRNLGPDALARRVNGQRYMYTPLHYVLDVTEDRFDVRAYYMDQPSILRKTFVGENDSAQIQVTVDSYQIERIDSGYRLTVVLASGDRFKELEPSQFILQLGYQPLGETSYASLNGTLIGEQGGERVYQFDIHTDMDIDDQDGLFTTNLSMFGETQRNFSLGLTHDLDLSFIGVNQDMRDYQRGDLDLLVQTHLLPNEFMVIGRERLQVQFGQALSSLWRRNRSIISPYTYKRYTESVPYVFEQTVLKRDENNQLIISQDADGNIEYTVEHQKGDPWLDDNGEPVYRHLKGDVILGDDGKPELIGPRRIAREFTLMLLDGCFYFVTQPEMIDYRDSIPPLVADWLATDIRYLQQQLLEQSELYFYPTATLGDTSVTVKEGQGTTMALDQSFYVNYYLTDSAYSNPAIREALSASTRTIVNELLGRRTVSLSDIIARLKANAGEDVINIEAGGLGGRDNVSVISVEDDAVRLTLRKRLVVLSNQFVTVQDDIDISFLRHSN